MIVYVTNIPSANRVGTNRSSDSGPLLGSKSMTGLSEGLKAQSGKTEQLQGFRSGLPIDGCGESYSHASVPTRYMMGTIPDTDAIVRL